MANIFDTIPADGGAAAASPPDGNVFDHIPTGNIFDTLPAEIPVTRTNPNLISATAGGTHGGGLNLTGFSKSDLPDAEDVHDVYSDLSRPAVPLPKFTVNPDDSRAKSVFKSAANMAISLPEFAESPLGVATGGAASVIPRLVAAGFLADTGTSVADQSTQLGSQWDSMTPGQRAAAVTDLGGSTLLAAAMAHGATRMPAKDAAAIEATAKQVEKPAAPAATPANAAPNVFDIIPPEAPAEKATAPVLHPDGTVNQIETALNQLRAESKEPAPVPPAAQTNPVIGEQPPAEPPVPVTPDLAAQIQAALRGNQLAPELPRPSEPAPLPPETSHVPAAVEPAPVPAAASTESEKPNEQSNQIPQNRQVPIAENPAAGRGETVQSGPALDVSQNDAGRQRPGANAGDASNPAAVPGAVAEAKDFTRQSAETKNAPAVASETPALAQSSDLDEQHALETVQEAFGLNKAQSARLAELQKKNASGIGGSPSQSKESASTATQPQAAAPVKVARGLRARKVFDNVTQMAGPDVLSWIAENQRMMSKSEAKSTLGKEWWQRNASLYDDSAPLKSPTHNVIYGGKSRPDQVAQAAYDAHVIKAPDVSTLWDAIHTASAKRASAYENSRANDAAMRAEAQEHQNWQKATAQGEQRVTPDQLKVGDVMEVGGERVKVREVDPDTGDVTLQDGSKFGRQVLRTGESIHVEKLDSAKYAAGDFSFDGMESDADQKARQLAEKRKADEAKAKAGMLDKAQARLTGKDLDTTREMFGADVKTDKSGQQSMFAKGERQTDTPEFKRWFGVSKVVDESGNPMRVYHETTAERDAGIGERGFDTSKAFARASDEGMPDGIFMKPTGKSIGIGGDNEVQLPLFAKIENPLRVETREDLKNWAVQRDQTYWELAGEVERYDKEKGREFDANEKTIWKPVERGAAMRKILDQEQQFLDEWESGNKERATKARARLTELIKAAGHDGVIINADSGSFGRKTKTVIAFEPTQVKSAIGNRGTFDPNDANILHASGNGRGLTVEAASDAINSHLGTKELPAGIKVIRDETAPWGARIEGRNKITVNAAQISTPERARAVILEEGLHGVWNHPDVQRAWQAVRDLVTPEEMRAEYLKRQAQGLPTDPATIREEAAIARLIKADANKGIFARVYQAIRTAIKRTFGIDLPAGGHEQLKEAATAFLRRDEGQEGAKGDLQTAFAKGDASEYLGGDDERPQRERSYPEVLAELKDAEDALKKATVRGDTKTQSQKEYQQAKALAGARYRTLRDELKLHPDRIADVMKDAARLSREARAARDAGNTAKAQSLESEMQGHADDLDRLPPKMVARIRDELIAKGELPKMAELAKPNAGRTLQKMTDELNKSVSDSPKVSFADRLAIGRKAAEAYTNGKDFVTKAWGNSVAASKALWSVFKAALLSHDFKDVMKSWIGYDTRTSIENARYVKALVDKVPQKVRRQAMSVWLDADGDKSTLEFQRQSVPEKYQPVWEAALNLTDGEKKIARDIKANFASKLDDGVSVGIIGKGREDYGVPQRWKVAPETGGADLEGEKRGKPGNPYAKLDPRDPFFSFQRNTDSYFDGIMAKGEPENLDIAHLVSNYDEAFHKALSSRGAIKALTEAKARDGQPIVKLSGKADIRTGDNPGVFVDSKSLPKDAVSADGRPYQTVDHWALRDWKFGAKDSNGNPILVRGDMLVHPDHVDFLRNELNTPRWTTKQAEGIEKVGRAALQASSYLKASKFIGPFHIVTEALHASFHGVVPSVHDFDINLDDTKQALLSRNMMIDMGSARQMYDDGVRQAGGGIWKHVPGLGDAIVRMNNFTFNNYIPKLKMKVGLAVLDRNMARYGKELSEDQIAELTGRQMDAAFGGQNWRLIGANKNVLAVTRLGLVAPDFLISRAKVIGQAFKPYNAEQRYFLLAQAVGVYALCRAANALFSDDHDPHFEFRNWDSVVIGKRAYHARFIVSDAANLARDLVGLGSFNQHGIPFISGRLGVLPKMGTEVLTGKDMFTGQNKDGLFNTDNPLLKAFSIVAKDTAEWMTPMGVDGFLPGAAAKGQTGLGSAVVATVGVSSRKESPANDVWDMARKFNLTSSDPKAVNYQKQRDNDSGTPSQYRALNNLLDAGQLDKAKQEVQALQAQGKTTAQIMQHYERSTYFTGSAAREQAFVASLSPAQKKVYQAAKAEQHARAATLQKAIQAQ